MGMRLHYAQHYDPDWQGGFFNRDVDAWDKLFNERFAENGHHNEISAYEVSRKDLQDYVNELKAQVPEAKNEYFVDYTNEQIVEQLSEVLTSDDDEIHIEWF